MNTYTKNKTHIEKARQDDGKFGQWERPHANIEYYGTKEYLERQKEVERLLHDRGQALTETGELAPSFTYAATDVTETTMRDVWWDRGSMSAGYSFDGRGIPMMPDDESILGKQGNALSGKRRTYRISFQDQNTGMKIRMPSIASIERYTKRKGLDSIRIPIQGQSQNGRSIIMNMIAHRTPNGGWVCEPEALEKSRQFDQLAAIVTARLEKRSLSMDQWREMRDDYHEKAPQYKTNPDFETKALKSSAISEAGFQPVDADTGIVAIRFAGGEKVYGFKASRRQWRRLACSTSPGQFFAEQMRGQLEAVPVGVCDSCKTWYCEGTKHECTRNTTGAMASTYDASARRVIERGQSRAGGKGAKKSERWIDRVGIFHSGQDWFKRKKRRKPKTSN